jgi:hypothetical protein
MSENGRNAYRAGGQAVAAILNGVPIFDVSIEGIAIAWEELPTNERSRSNLLGEASVGLAGVVAVERYGFGRAMDGTYNQPLRFDNDEIEDIVRAGALVAALDPDGVEDVLLRTWQDALELVANPYLWRVIERIAEVLIHCEISGDEALALFDQAMDSEMSLPMIPIGPI